jgi:subtilase family serine protease
MSLLRQRPISAQVVLVSKSKNKISGHTIITSENISDYSPDEKAINEIIKIFKDKGFDVGRMYGISISITAPKEVFEKFLDIIIFKEKDGSYGFVSKGKKLGKELTNELLPVIIKDKVQEITFSEPPDFGPTNW